ncbi:MAG: hypothetical protein IKO39_04730 [Treponema sp.]|nr:hypothetical protein [Treponema sp.]
MKKTLSIVAALLMCAGIAFADEEDRSIHSIGFSVPVMNQTWYDSSNDVETYNKFNGAGFDFMYHHLTVTPGNFSKFINCEIGYAALWLDEVERKVNGSTSTESVSGDEAKSFGGLIQKYSFGIGGAPVNSDRFILALHGTFGVNCWYGTRNFNSEESGEKIEFKDWAFSLWTTIGFNIDAAVRLSDHVGLFAGTNFYTNLVGFSVLGKERKTRSGSSTTTKTDSDGYAVYPGSFNVDFRFGVAFIF